VDALDLQRRLEVAKADAAGQPLGWGFYTYDPDFAACPMPAESGFARVMGVRAMWRSCVSRGSHCRTLSFAALRMTRARGTAWNTDLLAYGMPVEMTESAVATQTFFKDPAREFGYVAYVNGER
jgi:hypothetical protein